MSKASRWLFKKYNHNANRLGAIVHYGVGYTGCNVRYKLRDGKHIHHGVGYCGL